MSCQKTSSPLKQATMLTNILDSGDTNLFKNFWIGSSVVETMSGALIDVGPLTTCVPKSIKIRNIPDMPNVNDHSRNGLTLIRCESVVRNMFGTEHSHEKSYLKIVVMQSWVKHERVMWIHRQLCIHIQNVSNEW
jgi:hypothetical protein